MSKLWLICRSVRKWSRKHLKFITQFFGLWRFTEGIITLTIAQLYHRTWTFGWNGKKNCWPFCASCLYGVFYSVFYITFNSFNTLIESKLNFQSICKSFLLSSFLFFLRPSHFFFIIYDNPAILFDQPIRLQEF